ncbi:MAG: cytochrome c [Gemmatimonadaceae bacterium]|nr:cytochrome c [Gemmatimonadaceae bacterium]MCC6429889.1 cytochrome c [Gemmatimonadaceae bacterium]
MTLPTTIPTLILTTAVLLGAWGNASGNASGRANGSSHGERSVSAVQHVSTYHGTRVTTPAVSAGRASMTHAVTHPVTPRDSTPLYTEEQATAGEAVFAKVCAECHEKKDVTSADFRSKWHGRALLELYELIRTTMPDSNPGALSRDEYAGTLAYILKLNGVPAGPTAIMPDSIAMKAALLALPPVAP